MVVIRLTKGSSDDGNLLRLVQRKSFLHGVKDIQGRPNERNIENNALDNRGPIYLFWLLAYPR